MTKSAASLIAALFLFQSSASDNAVLRKHATLEVYKIRPEVLAIPRYTADGKICELGLERLQYVDGIMNVDTALDEKDVDAIFDEVAPPGERGPRISEMGGRDFILEAGQTLTLVRSFENVTLQFAAQQVSSKNNSIVTEPYTVAVITWKNRTCRPLSTKIGSTFRTDESR